jgi:hypothetical protein
MHRGLDPSQRRILGFYGLAWLAVGGFVAFRSCMACAAEGANALCAELALFGFLCWALLGIILGFPLYYCLKGHK